MRKKFEDTKEIIRSHNSKDRQYNGKKKGQNDKKLAMKNETQLVQDTEQSKTKTKQSIIGLYLMKFDDTKGIIRSHNLNDRQYNGQRKRTKPECKKILIHRT